MKKLAYLFALFSASLLTLSHTVYANTSYYVKPTFGYSIMADESANITNVLNQNGLADIKLENGFSAGIGVGYFINDRLALELGWEYRSNDSQVSLPEDTFEEGNYASNLFSANTYYIFANENAVWKPFIGGGLVYAQEIDIDLERDSIERSFSGSNDFGFQVMAGIGYQIDDTWSVQTEVRYISLSGISLDAEENVTTGRFEDLNYNPIDIQLSLSYRF